MTPERRHGQTSKKGKTRLGDFALFAVMVAEGFAVLR